MARKKDGKGFFNNFAASAEEMAGRAPVFVVAISIIIVWAVLGPVFGFSDSWQIVINTGTTIVTFLMVFLIQNAQNRESKATQLKLDELLSATKKARTSMVDLENLSDDELKRLEKDFERLRKKTEKQSA